MNTLSTSLAICGGKPLVISEFPRKWIAKQEIVYLLLAWKKNVWPDIKMESSWLVGCLSTFKIVFNSEILCTTSNVVYGNVDKILGTEILFNENLKQTLP